MLKIVDERKDEKHNLRCGDIVKSGEGHYLFVVQTSPERYQLISIRNGNRYTDRIFSSCEEIESYLNVEFDYVEFLPQDKVRIVLRTI